MPDAVDARRVVTGAPYLASGSAFSRTQLNVCPMFGQIVQKRRSGSSRDLVRPVRTPAIGSDGRTRAAGEGLDAAAAGVGATGTADDTAGVDPGAAAPAADRWRCHAAIAAVDADLSTGDLSTAGRAAAHDDQGLDVWPDGWQ